MKSLPLALVLALVGLAPSSALVDDVRSALSRAGANAEQLQAALDRCAPERLEGLRFLLTHMPQRDLESLDAEFLLENVDYAYRAWEESPWKDEIPKAIFLNDVLPYSNVNERRDRWRKDFHERFLELIDGAESLSQAAARINQKLFTSTSVKYSTKRRKPDQSPYETIESGLASCSGLSVLLIDACRAVGIPARFVGTPLWSDGSGNHSWVEIWDDGWHFTGAAEATGDELDKAWFVDRASRAKRDDPRNAIYAVSFKKTPLNFPLVWDRTIDYVHAVNVTDRYANKSAPLAKGEVRIRFKVRNSDGVRLATPLRIENEGGETVFEETTRDEGFDANDHAEATLLGGARYRAVLQTEDGERTEWFVAEEDEKLITWTLGTEEGQKDKASEIEDLLNDVSLGELKETPLWSAPLSKLQVQRIAERLRQIHEDEIRQTRSKEMEERCLRVGEHELRFWYKTYGDKPKNGRSLYISLHGGGGTAARVNDQQWENQKRLYKPDEGVYLAPRAPTNTWDLWHQNHIDQMFDRLIENLIVFEDVDPNRVYVLGYSAGGDGVYQLAPRMADRWAAAAMMAGHPNDASPLGLRNIGFALQVGGKDKAYDRDGVGRSWQKRLSELREADPDGYLHFAKIYEDKGHWMGGEDKVAVPWMAALQRNPRPERVVWVQDDVVHSRFYWLEVPKGQERRGRVIDARRQGQEIHLTTEDTEPVRLLLDDSMLDLDREVQVTWNGSTKSFRAKRTLATLARTLWERGDPCSVYSAEVLLEGPF